MKLIKLFIQGRGSPVRETVRSVVIQPLTTQDSSHEAAYIANTAQSTTDHNDELAWTRKAPILIRWFWPKVQQRHADGSNRPLGQEMLVVVAKGKPYPHMQSKLPCRVRFEGSCKRIALVKALEYWIKPMSRRTDHLNHVESIRRGKIRCGK